MSDPVTAWIMFSVSSGLDTLSHNIVRECSLPVSSSSIYPNVSTAHCMNGLSNAVRPSHYLFFSTLKNMNYRFTWLHVYNFCNYSYINVNKSENIWLLSINCWVNLFNCISNTELSGEYVRIIRMLPWPILSYILEFSTWF
jgi:hypothetical protein